MTRSTVNDFRDFLVDDAVRMLGPEYDGFVVTHTPTQNMVWTGGMMTIADAAQRLLQHATKGDLE